MAYTMLGGGATKALSVDQFFDYLKELEDPDDMRTLYRRVAWHYRCIQLRANAVAGIPFDLYPKDADPEKDKPVKDGTFPVEHLENYLWEAEAWLSLYGACYWLIQQNRLSRARKTLAGLQVLNAYTMEVKANETDPTKGIDHFEQQLNGKTFIYKPKQIVYFRRWSPETDLGPGVPPATPGAIPGELIYNLNQWARAFFENGAIPAVLLKTEDTIPEVEQERLRTMWRRFLKGVQKAFSLMLLQKGMDVQVLSQPVKDLAMPALAEEERFQIAGSYGIALSMLGAKDVNRATAEIDELKFWAENMIPEVRHKIAPTLNEQLFNPLGLQIAFHYKQIEAMQQREIQKAESAAFLGSGVMLPAYEANVVSIDETRAVIDALLQWVEMPRLDKTFTPEVRVLPAAPGGNGQEGPGTQTPMDERVESRTGPKAQAPDWGRHRVSLPS